MTIEQLQEANRVRGEKWGRPGLEFSAIELGGESGEVLNAVKKYIRFKNGMAGGVESLEPIEEELADVVICASLMSNDLNINLTEAIRRKFNKTSEKHGFPDRL